MNLKVILVFLSLVIGVIAIISMALNPVPNHFEPFTSDADMWYDILETYPDYYEMNDVEKTTALRMWAADHMYRSWWEDLYDHDQFISMRPYQTFNHFSTYHEEKAGVMCYGFALVLQKLYAYAGFKSYLYSYGFDDCCHALNLVWVRHPDTGEWVLIYHDPFFDSTVTWQNGTVMTFHEMLEEIRAERYENLVLVHEPAKPYIDYVGAVDAVFPKGYRVDKVVDLDEDTTLYRIWGMNEEYYFNDRGWIEGRERAFGSADINDWALFQYPREPVHPDIRAIVQEGLT